MQKPIPVDDILAQAGLYSLEEELRLIRELTGDVSRRIANQSKPRYSILDFEGIAHGTWDEVGGVDEFLKQERASWDG